MATDEKRRVLYVGNYAGSGIHKFNLNSMTLIGTIEKYTKFDGKEETLDSPAGMAVDSLGNVIVAECSKNTIVLVKTPSLVTGEQDVGELIVGGGTEVEGEGDKVKLHGIRGMTIAANDDVYFMDNYDNRIKKLNIAKRQVTVAAGTGEAARVDGSALKCTFSDVWTIAMNQDTNDEIYIAEYNDRIRRLDLKKQIVETVKLDYSEIKQTPSMNFRGLYCRWNTLYMVGDEGIIWEVDLETKKVKPLKGGNQEIATPKYGSLGFVVPDSLANCYYLSIVEGKLIKVE